MHSKDFIIKQQPVYIGDFKDGDDILQEFDLSGEGLVGVKILFAYYEYEQCFGEAFVLFEKDGDLYEVNGDHCSCYGLEGQWEPEEVSLAEMNNRLVLGTWGCGSFKKDLLKFLGVSECEVWSYEG